MTPTEQQLYDALVEARDELRVCYSEHILVDGQALEIWLTADQSELLDEIDAVLAEVRDDKN